MVNDPESYLRQWKEVKDGKVFHLFLLEDGFYFEAGPDSYVAWRYESFGGRWTFEEFRADPESCLEDFFYLFPEIDQALKDLGL